MKEDTIELLNKYTLLPIDISKEIVNEYIYDQEQTSFLTRMIKGRLNSQHRYTQIFIASYAILSMLVHLLCLILIGWINLESNGPIKSWCITVLVHHPMWKFINYAFSIHMLYADAEDADTSDNLWKLRGIEVIANHNRDKDIFKKSSSRSRYIFIIMLPYFIVCISCIIPVTFVFVIPAIFYYFPITLFLCCATCIGVIIIGCSHACKDKYGVMLKHTAFGDYKQMFKNIKKYILLAIPFYFMVMMSISAMFCNYSRQLNKKGFNGWTKYGICLYKGILEPQGYCHSFTIDWNDWRAIVLLISWILF